MRKALLLAGLLLAPVWSAEAPGISWVSGSLYRENPDLTVDAALRGSMTVRNDFGAELKNVRVVIHVLDGYGRPILDLPAQGLPRMAKGQSQTLPIFIGTYNGTVALFQLGADIDAQAAAGKQHFVITPHDAAAGTNPGFKGY